MVPFTFMSWLEYRVVKHWGKTWKIREPGTTASYFLPLPLFHSQRPSSSLSSTLPLPIFKLYGQLVAISAIWHQNTVKISHSTSAGRRQSCSQSANRSDAQPSSCGAEEGKKPSHCYNCRPDPALPKDSQMHLGLVWESKKNQIPKGQSRPRPWMRTPSKAKTKPVSDPGLWPALWEGQSCNYKSLMLSPVFTWLSCPKDTFIRVAQGSRLRSCWQCLGADQNQGIKVLKRGLCMLVYFCCWKLTTIVS